MWVKTVPWPADLISCQQIHNARKPADLQDLLEHSFVAISPEGHLGTAALFAQRRLQTWPTQEPLVGLRLGFSPQRSA
jgi:hypothetical protein